MIDSGRLPALKWGMYSLVQRGCRPGRSLDPVKLWRLQQVTKKRAPLFGSGSSSVLRERMSRAAQRSARSRSV